MRVRHYTSWIWLAVFATFLEAPRDGEAQIPRIGPEGVHRSLSKWIEDLKAPLPDQRKQAALMIAQKRAEAKEAVPALIAALKDADPVVRQFVAYALGEIGPGAAEAASALALALDDGESPVRSAAAEALGAIGPAAKEHAPALTQRLSDSGDYVRIKAAFALWRIDPRRAGESAAVLAKELSSKDGFVRGTAAMRLGEMGKDAAPAVGALIQVLYSGKESSHRLVAEALGEIGPAAKDAIPILLERYRKTDTAEKVRLAILGALAAIAADEPEVAAVLWAALTDQKTGPDAAHAIAKGGSKVVPILIGHVEKSPSAITALGGLGPAAKDAVPSLLRVARESRHDDVRRAAVRALQRIAPESLRGVEGAAVPADAASRRRDRTR